MKQATCLEVRSNRYFGKKSDTTQLASVKVSSKCIVLKLFMLQSTVILSSCLSKIWFPFPFTKNLLFGLWASASLVLCHFDTWLFGFSVARLRLPTSAHLLTGRLEVSPNLLALCSTNLPKWQHYSSEREREMRGPFLISFLFSSFLLLFSSSLRIFLKASAVWSTCGEMACLIDKPL